MGKAINRLEIWIELEATATIAGIGSTSSDSKEFYQKVQWQIPDVQIKGGGECGGGVAGFATKV